MCICRESISHSLEIFRDENDNYNSYSVDKASPFATSIKWNVFLADVVNFFSFSDGVLVWLMAVGTHFMVHPLHSVHCTLDDSHTNNNETVAVAHKQVVSKRRKCKRAIKDCIQFDVISYTLQQLFLTIPNIRCTHRHTHHPLLLDFTLVASLNRTRASLKWQNSLENEHYTFVRGLIELSHIKYDCNEPKIEKRSKNFRYRLFHVITFDRRHRNTLCAYMIKLQ